MVQDNDHPGMLVYPNFRDQDPIAYLNLFFQFIGVQESLMRKSSNIDRVRIALRLFTSFVGLFCLGAALAPRPALACPNLDLAADEYIDLGTDTFSQATHTVELWARGKFWLGQCAGIDVGSMGIAPEVPSYSINYTSDGAHDLYLQLDDGQHCEATMLVWAVDRWRASKKEDHLPPQLLIRNAPNGRYVVFIGKLHDVYPDCPAKLYMNVSQPD